MGSRGQILVVRSWTGRTGGRGLAGRGRRRSNLTFLGASSVRDVVIWCPCSYVVFRGSLTGELYACKLLGRGDHSRLSSWMLIVDSLVFEALGIARDVSVKSVVVDNCVDNDQDC